MTVAICVNRYPLCLHLHAEMRCTVRKSALWLLVMLFSVAVFPLQAASLSPDRLWPPGGEREGETGALVILREQADLRPAYRIPDVQIRRRWVYLRLLSVARRTQPPLMALLRSEGVKVRSFYIVNALYLPYAPPDLLHRLAARKDVARIVAAPRISQALPRPARMGQVERAAAIEPNIAFIGAPQVWALGYRGQGIVIGGQDTGYAWQHEALKSHYRGWDGAMATHDYNWHDAIHTDNGDCPADSPQPCDDYGHGTHTMGIAVGDDGGANQIGVAPAAQWIGCRNMNNGVGSPATYLECFEFFLAPYPIGASPDEGRPELAPDITTNSWSCPPSEGCDAETLQQAVEAERAAGIFTVVAAGNSGSGCSTVSDPPAIYAAALTIGATGRADNNLAYFSSRGPVTVDNSGRRKPDLTAPGRSIRSAYPAKSDTTMSGTSMATPHVAGTVALLWSAAPWLRAHITATTYVLTSTAVAIASADCSSDGVPNNLYGWGRVDAAAAVTMALTSRSQIIGRLCNASDKEPGGQLIVARALQNGDLWSTTTTPSGTFTLTVLAGPYQLHSPVGDRLVMATSAVTTHVEFGCERDFYHYLPLILRGP